MRYIYDIFYDNKEDAQEEYERRFNFEGTLKTDLSYKYIDSTLETIPYFVYNAATAKLVDIIRKNDTNLIHLVNSLSDTARKEFYLQLVTSEIINSATCEESEIDCEDINEVARDLIYSNKKIESPFKDVIGNYYSLIYNTNFEDINVPKNIEDFRTIYDEMLSSFINRRNSPDGKLFRATETYVKLRGENKSVVNIGGGNEEEIISDLNIVLDFMKEEDVPLIIKAVIVLHHIVCIRPFYDGNQRLARYIASALLREDYSFATSLSLGRGTLYLLKDFYELSGRTLSSANMGELNSFVDIQLLAIIKGQDYLLDYIKYRIDKIQNFKENLADNKLLNSTFKKEVLNIMAQNHYFDDLNIGFCKEKLVDEITTKISKTDMEKELDELVKDEVLYIVENDPTIYRINVKYLGEAE